MKRLTTLSLLIALALCPMSCRTPLGTGDERLPVGKTRDEIISILEEIDTELADLNRQMIVIKKRILVLSKGREANLTRLRGITHVQGVSSPNKPAQNATPITSPARSADWETQKYLDGDAATILALKEQEEAHRRLSEKLEVEKAALLESQTRR